MGETMLLEGTTRSGRISVPPRRSSCCHVIRIAEFLGGGLLGVGRPPYGEPNCRIREM